MSENMSEDEIIKILEDACILDELCYGVDYLEEKQLKAIRSLYLLYKQEKEKNEKYIIHLTDEQYKKVIDIAQKDCIRGLLDTFITYKKLPGTNQYEWHPNVDDNSSLVNEMIKIVESEGKDDDRDMKIRRGIIGFKNFMDVIFDNNKEEK